VILSALPAHRLAVCGAEDWPTLEIGFAERPVPGPRDIYVDPGPDGVVCIDPDGVRAVLSRPAGMPLDDLIHPSLGAAAWLAARRSGQEVMHAGACLASAGGAYILIGGNGAGKSTMLALLHRRGRQILADDMVVFRADEACAGPRCLDLRPDAAERLGLGSPVRGESKRRVSLPPIRAQAPVLGFIHLDWAPRLELAPLPPSERMRRLLAHADPAPRRRPQDLLRLAALPHHRLARPRGWDTAEHAAELLDAELLRR
jgi:hypothetical protein